MNFNNVSDEVFKEITDLIQKETVINDRVLRLINNYLESDVIYIRPDMEKPFVLLENTHINNPWVISQNIIKIIKSDLPTLTIKLKHRHVKGETTFELERERGSIYHYSNKELVMMDLMDQTSVNKYEDHIIEIMNELEEKLLQNRKPLVVTHYV